MTSTACFNSENESKTFIQASISYNLRNNFIIITEKLKSYLFLFFGIVSPIMKKQFEELKFVVV